MNPPKDEQEEFLLALVHLGRKKLRFVNKYKDAQRHHNDTELEGKLVTNLAYQVRALLCKGRYCTLLQAFFN